MNSRDWLAAAAFGVALGGAAVALQWSYAAPVTNGWFCTGRLACWLWTRANMPAYMVASVLDDSDGAGESFVPIAIGVFAQWAVIGGALGAAAMAIREGIRRR